MTQLDNREGRPDRERRFDDELARAARSLVTEELPRDILGAPVSTALGLGRVVDGAIATRRPLPGLATAIAAGFVLLLATFVVFAPQLPGGPGPSATPSPTATAATSATPSLRTTAEIRADFESLGYSCHAGQVLPSIVPGPSAAVRESLICTPAANSVYMGAVIIGESARDAVVEVHAKADFIGADTPSARTTVASVLAKAAAVVVSEGTGTAVGGWVQSTAPAVEPGGGEKAQVEGYALKVGRTSDGGYQLFVTIAATS